MIGEHYLPILKLLTNELTTSELKNPKLVVETSFVHTKQGKAYTRTCYPGMGQYSFYKGI